MTDISRTGIDGILALAIQAAFMEFTEQRYGLSDARAQALARALVSEFELLRATTEDQVVGVAKPLHADLQDGQRLPTFQLEVRATLGCGCA